jgi:hypothetical protein
MTTQEHGLLVHNYLVDWFGDLSTQLIKSKTIVIIRVINLKKTKEKKITARQANFIMKR